MNLNCLKCKSSALWKLYSEEKQLFCDEHVPRGCSCNIDEKTGKEELDNKGRQMPCCKFIYNEKGFEK